MSLRVVVLLVLVCQVASAEERQVILVPRPLVSCLAERFGSLLSFPFFYQLKLWSDEVLAGRRVKIVCDGQAYELGIE